MIPNLRNRGLIIKTPRGSENKLTRSHTNESRFSTKTRYVVEVRNTHIKNKWKYLSNTKIYQSIPNLKKDFQIASAFVNAFCKRLRSDPTDSNRIAALMLSKRDQQNTLSRCIQHFPNTSFRQISNLTLHPKFSSEDLKNISLGTFQIRLAKSYCQAHLKANNNEFIVHVCDDIALCQKYFQDSSHPLLLRFNSVSRFRSATIHKTYVLLNFSNQKFEVKGYCCTCRHGCRTVGCCGHVMSLIWYTLHVDENTVRDILPSKNFDDFFGNWMDE